MKKKINNLKEKFLISGGALESIVKTMTILGDIGKEVLKKYNIKSIDKDISYPIRIRTEIHKEVFNQYGKVALEFIGFSQGETNFPLSKTENLYKSLEKTFKSENEKNKLKALEQLTMSWISEGDEITKLVNKGNSNYKFGVVGKKINSNTFKIYAYSTWEKFQFPLFNGVIDYTLCRFCAKYWKYKITFNDEETKTDKNGFCTYSFTLEFEPRLNKLSQELIYKNHKQKIKDVLLKKVLDSSTKKNKELEIQKRQIENISQQIGKYIPPQIHEALFVGKYNTEIVTRRKKLTIFFSDIANFTSTAEDLQPEDLTKYLNEYFSEMTKIALDHGATIDKYIGDAMMLFFGDPSSKGEKKDARSCVQMALKMQEKMRKLQRKWLNEGFSNPFQVRMGINTGYCNVGNFGSNQRLTYTIIGGEVNVAQRLESSADPNGILMSFETYAHAQDLVKVEERESIKMKGINRDIKVMSVIYKKSNFKFKNNNLNKKSTTDNFSEIKQLQNKMEAIESDTKKLHQKIDNILKRLN